MNSNDTPATGNDSNTDNGSNDSDGRAKTKTKANGNSNGNGNAVDNGSNGSNGGNGGNGNCPAAVAKFDIEQFRISQDFVAAVGGTKHILNVPIRRPKKHEWFTVHPGEGWRIMTAMLHWTEERGEFFVVAPKVRPDLAAHLVPVLLVTCVNMQGSVFLWPVRWPAQDGRANAWHLSGVEAFQLAAKGGWVRMEANMDAGAYELMTAVGELGEPQWPMMSFEALLEKAFRDKLIDSLDHPVVRRLRGEA